MKKVKELILRKENEVIYVLSTIYSLLLIFGLSYQIKGNASLVFGNLFFFFLALLLFFILFTTFKIGLEKVFSYLDSRRIFRETRETSRFRMIFDRHPFLVSMGIMLLCWLPYIISFYPAILSPDPSFQIKQFFGIPNKYSTYVNLIDSNVLITSHHPVIHTLLLGGCLKIGTILGNDNFGLFIYSLIQIFVLSSVLSYTITYMKKLQVPYKLRCFFLGLYALVPMFPLYSMSAVKDVLFTCFVILYMIFIYDVLKNKEQKLTLKKWILAFITMILVVLFRNNGIHMILLSFPFLILCSKLNFKKLLFLFVAILSFNYCYTDIVLPYYKITPGSIREVLSIPFQQTARFVKYDGDKLSESEKEKIDVVLGFDDLASRYKPELSDPVKNQYNRDTTKEQLKDYFGVWFSCFFKDPVLYVDATINNIYGYFYPLKNNWYIYHKYNATIVADGFDYHYNSLSLSRSVLSKFGLAFPFIPVVGLVSNIGFSVWLLFLFTGYLIYQKRSRGVVFLLPSFALLLVCVASPANTYFRYAMPFIFAMPMLFCFLIDYVKERRSSK